MQDQIQSAARWLAKCRLVVVLTGAGVSKESGIPTFRDAQDGLWAQYDPMVLATEAGYLSNPALVWQWYDYRFGMVEHAQPNPGHRAIAELERLLPQVVVVTQNIDGLHQAAGSNDVVELHGSMRSFKCLTGRHTGFTRADFAGRPRSRPVVRAAAICFARTWSGSGSCCRAKPSTALTIWPTRATPCWWLARQGLSSPRPRCRSSRAMRAPR